MSTTIAAVNDLPGHSVRNPFARTGTLLRLTLRRERWMLLVTTVVFVGLNLATAASIQSMYPTSVERAAAQMDFGSNAAFLFLLGPLRSIDSTAALVVWRAGLFMVIALAVCVVLMVIRSTRKEEELGRTELLRAGVTGPLAPLAAAAIAATAFSVMVAAGMSLMLFAFDADPVGVAAVFAQYSTTGMAAAGIALVTAQVAKTSHIANLTASSIVLLGYLLRGIADAGSGWDWLRAVTPMGWAQLIDPFGHNNFWFALASLGVFAAGCVIAAALVVRRDLGAGLLAQRPGPAGTGRLSSVEWVVVRLLGPLLASWVGGVVVYAVIVGFLVPSVDELATGNAQFGKVVAQQGLQADLSILFVITMMSFFAVVAGAWAVAVAARMRGEERAARTELLLSTPTARRRCLLAHVGFAALGVVAILLLGAAGVALGTAIAGGDLTSVGADAIRAGMAQVPAAFVIASLTLALYAVRASLAQVGWVVVLAALFLGPLSGMFDLPQWAKDLSPFSHTPLVPVSPLHWTPLLVMLCVAPLFTAGAVIAFRRRDIG